MILEIIKHSINLNKVLRYLSLFVTNPYNIIIMIMVIAVHHHYTYEDFINHGIYRQLTIDKRSRRDKFYYR